MKYRSKNGRYKSRKCINLIALLIVGVPLIYVLLSATFGVSTHSFSAVHIQEVEAAPEIEVIEVGPGETVEWLEHVDDIAEKYEIDGEHLRLIPRCEHGWYHEQSLIRYNFSDPKRGIRQGDRERSFGPYQIHIPDHPQVSIADALDPYTSAEWAAKKIADGYTKSWYAYDYKNKKCI